MRLTRYQAKRNFSRTREPKGGRAIPSGRHSKAIFVVQKHAAKRLHYDFRLAMDGALKSWAVPKGIPTKQGEKRLAMQVEDHPLEYANFEGTIPKGNYGAGSVMVWDMGAYEVLDDEPATALRKGKILLELAGKKLNGQWTLVRMRRRDEQDERAWLLIKTGKDARCISSREDDTSARSGRTMEQIAAADGDTAETQHAKSSKLKLEDHSHHDEHGKDPLSNLNGLPTSAPRFAEPMKALLQAELPKGRDWLFEVKLDGIRAIGIKNGRQVRIFSRRPRELTMDYPEIAEALRNLPAEKLVVDGEIAALDEKGRSSFQLLQNLKQSSASRPPVSFYLFDLLNLNGHDLESLPLMKRKAALETLLSDGHDPLRLSASLEADPSKIWKQVKRLGLEGLIAKRRDSQYEPGRRSGAWLKIKAQNEQEFVIGGYNPPQGSRKYFGSLLVGYYTGGDLVFAGKVGTGFNARSLKSLYEQFQKYRTSACPFAELLTKRSGRSNRGITAAEMKRCVWLKPELVCQVKFLEWTRGGILRQPVFLGLREDKKPQQVVREVT